MLENPMVAGVGAYKGEYAPPTDYYCPRCKTPLDYRTDVFEWDDGTTTNWICGECFVDAIHSLSKADRAEMANDTIARTEEQMEDYHGDASAYGSIFDISRQKVGDIA
jgi:hypothetical protein